MSCDVCISLALLVGDMRCDTLHAEWLRGIDCAMCVARDCTVHVRVLIGHVFSAHPIGHTRTRTHTNRRTHTNDQYVSISLPLR
eukprot:COSAG06_NODE_4923_length_3856_cov_3.048177_4_plen_84_part_00